MKSQEMCLFFLTLLPYIYNRGVPPSLTISTPESSWWWGWRFPQRPAGEGWPPDTSSISHLSGKQPGTCTQINIGKEWYLSSDTYTLFCSVIGFVCTEFSYFLLLFGTCIPPTAFAFQIISSFCSPASTSPSPASLTTFTFQNQKISYSA